MRGPITDDVLNKLLYTLIPLHIWNLKNNSMRMHFDVYVYFDVFAQFAFVACWNSLPINL